MKSLTAYLGVVGILVLNVFATTAQVSTIKPGSWSAPSTWSTGIVPDATAASVMILHNVTLQSDTSVIVDNLTISATLTIEKHAELILSHDAGATADLIVNAGTLQVFGNLTCQDGAIFSGTSTSNTFFYDSAIYEHRYVNTAGEPPLATWSKGSEMLITGYVFGKSLNGSRWNQSYGNITYDCAGQRSGTFVEMLGNIQHVKGNFVVKSTNSGVLRFSLDKTSLTNILIEGDLIIEGRSEFWLGRNANIALHIGGDFVFRSTATASTYLTTTGHSDVVVEGSVIINSTAPLRFASSGGGHAKLYVKKNFMLSQGNVTVLPIGTGELIFNGTQGQTLHNAGILATGIDVVVDDADVSITNNSKIGGNLFVKGGSKLFLPLSCTLESNLDVEIGADVVDHQGTIHLNGAINQWLNLSGDTLHNVSITKPASTFVTLSSKLNLAGNLSIKSSNTTFDSNGFLTLLSQSDDGSNDATIQTLPHESAVVGNVTIQRYMSGEGRIYRYISSPVQAATVSDCKDDFPVTGNFLDPSSGGGLATTNASFFYYDETLSAGAGWIGFPTSGLSTANVLTPARGYTAFIRKSVGPTIWDVDGVINQHEIAFPITNTLTGDLLNDGWNLVGNPYPAHIDWDLANGWEKFNVADKVAVKDNGTGMFHYWSEGIGSLNEGRIAKGQAFWIQTTGDNAHLMINENAKSILSTAFHRGRTSSLDYIELALHHNGRLDKAFLRQKSETSFQLDQSDVTKWTNDQFNISFPYDSIDLSIQNIEYVDCRKVIPLRVYFTKNSHGEWITSPLGDYVIESYSAGTFSNAQILLHDYFMNQTRALNVPYNFSITSDVRSTYENRFALELIADTVIHPIKIHAVNAGCDSMEIELANLQRGVSYTCTLNGTPYKNFHCDDDSTIDRFILHENEMIEGENVLEIKARTACASRKIQLLRFQNVHDELPEITEHDRELMVSFPGKKQWFLNGRKLDADTLDTCVIIGSGLYEVEVDRNGCISRVSYAVRKYDEMISCYPNPTNSSITIISSKTILSIALIDHYGRLILNEDEIRSDNHTVNMKDLAKGAYILSVRTEDKLKNMKIVKVD